MGDQPSSNPPRTPFTVALNELNRGRVADDATDALAEVVAAVRSTGKKGTLVVTLEVAPVKKSDGQQVLVTADVTAKAPKPDAAPSFYFTTPHGELTRNINREDDLFTAGAPDTLKEV